MDSVDIRTLGVVTVARSDFGLYTPLLNAINKDAALQLQLFVAGMHLSPHCEYTVRMVEEAYAKAICARVDMKLAGDSPEAIADAMGSGVSGFAHVFAQTRPDILVVLGDRFDMYCAALAALPFNIPVAHLHGGELTEGAMDDALRHSITKLSHLHFTATKEYARRVIQLGEDPWRVTVSGALGLDQLSFVKLLSVDEMSKMLDMDLHERPVLVTYHPVTLQCENTAWQVDELLTALDAVGMPVVFTAPNADTSHCAIRTRMLQYVARHSNARWVEDLGTQKYFSMMALARAMVGNSSSGIIEAASFRLPVVNIGIRQRGRDHGENVIDTGYLHEEVICAIRRAVDPLFREGLCKIENRYGDGRATERIVERLKNIALDEHLLIKRFHNVEGVDL